MRHPLLRLAVRIFAHRPFIDLQTDIYIYIDVGEDVDMCIQRLFQAANYDPHRARYHLHYFIFLWNTLTFI
jgi:hypothetical protein